jgi:hypothetical protein
MAVIPHPPYSPDLAPFDFLLFPKIKLKLKGRRFDTCGEIQAELQRVLDSLTEQQRVLDTLTEQQRVLDSVTEQQRVLDSLTEQQRVLDSLT